MKLPKDMTTGERRWLLPKELLERIKAEKKTINKILNVAKFVYMFEKPLEKPKLNSLDSLFLDYIEFLTKFTEENYEKTQRRLC